MGFTPCVGCTRSHLVLTPEDIARGTARPAAGPAAPAGRRRFPLPSAPRAVSAELPPAPAPRRRFPKFLPGARRSRRPPRLRAAGPAPAARPWRLEEPPANRSRGRGCRASRRPEKLPAAADLHIPPAQPIRRCHSPGPLRGGGASPGPRCGRPPQLRSLTAPRPAGVQAPQPPGSAPLPGPQLPAPLCWPRR